MNYNYCPECGKELTEKERKIYYCLECYEDWSDDDNYNEEDYREDIEERRQEELSERASLCKCGAWQFAKDGSVVHVADCCCGAE